MTAGDHETDDRFEELDDLLLAGREGALDDEARTRLNELLRSSEPARERFVDLQAMTLALELEDGAESATTAVPVTAKSESPRRRGRWLVALAVALGVLVATRWLFLEATRSEPSPSEPRSLTREDSETTATGVAIVTRLVDVGWAGDGPTFELGDAIPPGRVAIASGFAQVEFFCGATVVLEGPAELDVESATSARFLAGRLRAKVPPAARGFEIHVGDMTVVDLGTDFGLSVSPESADVQVFDGEVEVHGPEGAVERVLGGNAVRRADGRLAKAELDPERFVNIAGLDERERRRTRAGYERWLEHSQSLRRHPRLIAYYTFDDLEPWQRTLPSSVIPENGELGGAIVGARHVAGRWPGKGALEFKRPGDRVKVHVPGEFSSLTLACWVRIDSLDRWYNSLFLTDRYEQGEPHWQILDTGQLFFSVRAKAVAGRGPVHRKIVSKPFWDASMSGEWLHLATTFDAETGRVTHYLDGETIHSELLPDDLLPRTTRIGTASIGNWAAPTKPDAEFAVRNLNGRIDELALFAAVLDEDDIREMYEHGKP